MQKSFRLVFVLLVGILTATMFSTQGFNKRQTANPVSGASIQSVVINEIAWGGTAADVTHEWIELFNTTPNTVSLAGWQLVAEDGTPDIALHGPLGPYQYFLIERNDDTVVSDIPGDIIIGFGQGLSNYGEILYLKDELGYTVDTVNPDGGGWVNADFGATPYFQSLERRRPNFPGTDDNWISNDGSHTINGLDANGDPLTGTPRSINAATLQSPSEYVDLSIVKSGPALIDMGDLITYTIVVSYQGNITASNVLVTDTLPAGTLFINQTSRYASTQEDDHLYWQLGDVGPWSAISDTITVTVQNSGGSSVWLTNVVTISTSTYEEQTANNVSVTLTEVSVTTFDKSSIKISALLFDGYQPLDTDDAIQLSNAGLTNALIKQWQLCKDDDLSTICRDLPEILIPAQDDIWLTKSSTAFYRSFGHAPDYEITTLPGFVNSTGNAIRLIDELGITIDTITYGDISVYVPGWSGPTLSSYSVSPRHKEGQILARMRDEQTYLPVSDTNTAADWMQYTGDPRTGRHFLYPGWDYERLFKPITTSESADVKVGIAPDNAFQLVYDLIASAQSSIEISMYTFTHPGLINLLASKAQSGVTVRILLEGGPVAVDVESEEWQTELYACAIIENAGGECWFMIHDPAASIFNRYTYLHAKTILVDREWLLVSTQNFEFDGLPSDGKANGTLGSRGYVMATNASDLVEYAGTIYDLDLDSANHNDLLRWNTGYFDRYGSYNPALVNLDIPDPTQYTVRFPAPLGVSGTYTFELFTAPEAALRSSDALIGLVNSTGTGDEVFIEQAYEYSSWGATPENDPNLRLLSYIEAARRGARVRILLNGQGYTIDTDIPPEDNLVTINYINDLAMRETLDLKAAAGNPTLDGIHSKIALVSFAGGDRITHMGSINGSEASSKINRELALQITSPEVFNYVYKAFAMDWWLSNPLYLPVSVKNADARSSRATHVVISEIVYNDSRDKEWVELYNPTSVPLDISGYHLGDAAERTDFEAMFIFPSGAVINPGETLVVAVNGSSIVNADYEFYESSTVPNMVADLTWGNVDYPFALHNDGDEVLLLDVQYQAIDVVTWGTGLYPDVIAHPGVVIIGASLERYPANSDTDSCLFDFRERYPPTPGEVPYP